jgi:hypothetical protein
MLRDGLDILFYNCEKDVVIIQMGTKGQALVVTQRFADTCGKELAGYRVNVRNTDNVEVSVAVFGIDKKE